MILITGATGHIGGEVIQHLIDRHPELTASLRAMVRDVTKAETLVKLGVEVVRGDFDNVLSLGSALHNVNRVFLTIPESPRQFDWMNNFLTAAKQAGQPQIVMLSGAEASADSARIISRWHWQMQQQILESGLPYTFLQPVYIMQNVLEYFEVIRQTGKFYGPIAGDVPFSMVSPQDIAASAAAVLTQPGHETKEYTLTGSETLSLNAVAAAYRHMLHREVTYIQVPRENAIAQLIGRGQPDWIAEAIISMLPPAQLITTIVADLTGQPPLTLSDYMQTQFGQTGQYRDIPAEADPASQAKPRASLFVQPTSLIRWVGYEAQPGNALLDEAFISAWQSVADQSVLTDGVVYRELCRQVPEWNAQITAEIQTPNPFTFIDYTILQPDADLTTLPDLPSAIATHYTRVEGTYRVLDHYARPGMADEPEMIFYNLFQINTPQVEQGFILNWPNRADFQALQPGFFSAMLHRRTDPGVPVNAFNRAEWLNSTAYANTIELFDRLFPVQNRAGGPDGSQAGPMPIRSMLGLFRLVSAVEGKPAPPQPPMKAIQFHRYGGPEVLQYEDIPQPIAGHGEIKVAVHAVSVNSLDAKIRAGDVRMIHPAWFPDILGFDIAGTVDALGSGVTGFAVGDEVFGSITPLVRRGYAEYVTAAASAFQHKPRQLDFIQAAAVPSVAYTASNALFTIAGLHAGQTVLIHGGSGAVGTFAIQLAKQAGATVIATASAANLDYMRGLGADQVIDYRAERFETLVSNVDVVFDTQGGDTRARSWGVLRRGGVLVTLVPPLPDQAQAAKFGVRAMMNQNQDDSSAFFTRFAELLDHNQLQLPRISAVLPLSEAAEAHRLLDQGHVQGRIVLTVR